MRLHLTATSERGKPVTKSGNSVIDIEVLNENREVVLDITLQPHGENGLVHALIRQGDITKTLWAGFLKGKPEPKTARECAHGARIDETCLTCSPELRELFK